MVHSNIAPILHFIIPFLVVGIIVYGVIMLLLTVFDKKENTAIQILKERYAKGEIDEEEYKTKVTFLNQK